MTEFSFGPDGTSKCVNCGEKKRMPKFRGMAESTY